MATEAQRETLNLVERHIGVAMDLLGSVLPPTVRGEVQHFIDHDEQGLAFEQLLFASREIGFPINAEAGAELDHAARLMRFEAGLWQQPLQYLEKVRRF